MVSVCMLCYSQCFENTGLGCDNGYTSQYWLGCDDTSGDGSENICVDGAVEYG